MRFSIQEVSSKIISTSAPDIIFRPPRGGDQIGLGGGLSSEMLEKMKKIKPNEGWLKKAIKAEDLDDGPGGMQISYF